MNLHDRRFDRETVPTHGQEERIFEVGQLTSALSIDAHQGQLLPDLVEQDVDAEVHMNRDAGILGVLHELIDILN